MKSLFKLISTTQSATGYGLAELLIAASATLLVVGVASFGLGAMIQGNKTAKDQIDRRTEVNRALDFISDEVRRSATVNVASTVSGFDATDKTVVMVLDLPNGQKAVYYVTSNVGTDWVGPKVLYRWGPPLDSNGSYGTGSNTTAALIDRVDDAVSTPSCATTFSASPSSNAQGFYACIADTNKMAQLHLNVQFNNNEKYTATTNVFARALDDPGVASPTLPLVSSPGPTASPLPPSDTPPNRTVRVLESSYACTTGVFWNVETVITILDSSGNPIDPTVDTFDNNGNRIVRTNYSNPLTIDKTTPPDNSRIHLNTDAGETLKIESVPTNPTGASCNNKGDTLQYPPLDPNNAEQKLKAQKPSNGDDAPNTPGFQDQKSVKDSLKDTVNNGKITLKTNESLYLFELGQSDTNSTGFDLQDNVVLVSPYTPAP